MTYLHLFLKTSSVDFLIIDSLNFNLSDLVEHYFMASMDCFSVVFFPSNQSSHD